MYKVMAFDGILLSILNMEIDHWLSSMDSEFFEVKGISSHSIGDRHYVIIAYFIKED